MRLCARGNGPSPIARKILIPSMLPSSSATASDVLINVGPEAKLAPPVPNEAVQDHRLSRSHGHRERRRAGTGGGGSTTTKATESACRTCAYVPSARVREQGGKSEREACLMATRSGLCPPGLQRGAGVW